MIGKLKSILKLIFSGMFILIPLTAMSMEIVSFKNDKVELKGELYKPEGKGPFPAILFNHGSAPKMLNSMASEAIAPYFTKKGWVFFMPYRRGQGLSEQSGPYIGDEIDKAMKTGGLKAASKVMVRLLSTDHLGDQLAGLRWLNKQSYIRGTRIATLGNSFGGIEVMLGVSNSAYCAGVNASGGAQSWSEAPELRTLLKDSAKSAKVPVMFFQAENDYDLSPSRILYQEMKAAQKVADIKIYPSYGKTKKEGHSFPYRAVSVWFDDAFSFIAKYCPDTK